MFKRKVLFCVYSKCPRALCVAEVQTRFTKHEETILYMLLIFPLEHKMTVYSPAKCQYTCMLIKQIQKKKKIRMVLTEDFWPHAQVTHSAHSIALVWPASYWSFCVDHYFQVSSKQKIPIQRFRRVARKLNWEYIQAWRIKTAR